MKRNVLIAAFLFLLFACSKEKTPTSIIPDVPNIIGTWSIYSVKDINGSDLIYATVNDYPCLANDKIDFKADFTLTIYYTGKDTCWITPPPTTPVNFRAGTTVGSVDQAPKTSQWSQSGTTLYLGTNQDRATITKNGGKIFLTQIDTISTNLVHDTITIVHVKN